MKGKTSLRALIGLVAVVAIVVGVLVWPTPKEAKATNLQFKLEVTSWGWPIEEYNLAPIVQLLDNAFIPVGNPFPLNSINNSHYSGTYEDAPTTVVYAEVDWTGGGLDWGFEGEGQAFGDPPVIVEVNWTGTNYVLVWCSWNGR